LNTISFWFCASSIAFRYSILGLTTDIKLHEYLNKWWRIHYYFIILFINVHTLTILLPPSTFMCACVSSRPVRKYWIVRSLRHYQPRNGVKLNRSARAVNVHKLLTIQYTRPVPILCPRCAWSGCQFRGGDLPQT